MSPRSSSNPCAVLPRHAVSQAERGIMQHAVTATEGPRDTRSDERTLQGPGVVSS